jgi:hypothetical protein
MEVRGTVENEERPLSAFVLWGIFETVIFLCVSYFDSDGTSVSSGVLGVLLFCSNFSIFFSSSFASI